MLIALVVRRIRILDKLRPLYVSGSDADTGRKTLSEGKNCPTKINWKERISVIYSTGVFVLMK